MTDPIEAAKRIAAYELGSGEKNWTVVEEVEVARALLESQGHLEKMRMDIDKAEAGEDREKARADALQRELKESCAEYKVEFDRAEKAEAHMKTLEAALHEIAEECCQGEEGCGANARAALARD